MRRRLDVAASLVGRPKVLFLDEPTTGLDPRARADVWELVRGLVADGTTVLLTTQYLQEADQLCHGVSLIDHGRVVRHGTPAELKATVGGQTLHVRPDDRARAGETGVIVTELLGGAVATESDDGLIAAPLPTGYSAAATLAAAAARLESAGIEVAEMGVRLASLDEAFLALTGDHATTEALR
jgi:oleandomycin transport system ATP-binding protein